MTILSRLFVLVAVALLPAIAIQAYNEFDLRRDARSRCRTRRSAWPSSPQQSSSRSSKEFVRS